MRTKHTYEYFLCNIKDNNNLLNRLTSSLDAVQLMNCMINKRNLATAKIEKQKD